jgi:tetratricopeptide (TPR) repeat protein
MSKRKTVRWVLLAGCMFFMLLLTPVIAAVACFFVGAGFQAAGNYQAAAGAFNGAVRLYPRFARGYVELGSSYLALKKYSQAEAAFHKAKSIDDDSCASCGLGMTYHKLRRYDDAEREFKRSMSLNPRDHCAYDQSGRMYYDLGKYPEAIGAFKRALELSPSYGTYLYLANSYVYTRDFEPAIDAYKEALRLNPKYVSTHNQLGIAYDYMGRFKEAAAEYEQLVKLDPDDHEARSALIYAYMNLHNKTAALEQYEILRKLKPELAADVMEAGALAEPREKGKAKLYFVPLNNFPAASLTRLVNSCKQRTGIEVIVMQPVPFTLSTINKQRQQVDFDEAVTLIKKRYPKLAADPNAIVIGLTDEDMYVRKEKWQYAFAYPREGRFAIVSSSRMNPVNIGGEADEALLDSRLRKMVLKEIGVLYYQYPPNHNPQSVLYDQIEGVEDFDKMGEDF